MTATGDDWLREPLDRHQAEGAALLGFGPPPEPPQPGPGRAAPPTLAQPAIPAGPRGAGPNNDFIRAAGRGHAYR
jgi:hypothetical protein